MNPDIWNVIAATLVGINTGAAIMARGKSIGWNVAAVTAILLLTSLRGWL